MSTSISQRPYLCAQDGGNGMRHVLPPKDFLALNAPRTAQSQSHFQLHTLTASSAPASDMGPSVLTRRESPGEALCPRVAAKIDDAFRAVLEEAIP